MSLKGIKIYQRVQRIMSDNNIGQFMQTELFQKVSSICAIVNSVIDEREFLQISLSETMDLLGAKRGSIFLLKENTSELELKAAIGMEGAEKRNMVKRLGEGVVGRVAATKKPIYVKDIATDDRFQNYKARGSYQSPSFICAPLLIKDRLIGVINVADKEGGVLFGKEELYLLDFLASQIALNYRRIGLYYKFKTILRESQDLKNELGKSSQEATHLKKQVLLHEKLATIGKLAGGIAHEFNNPLDGVMRYTNLCLEHVKEDEVVRGYLLEIKHGLNRMATIVSNLLACSRNVSPSMQKVDVNASLDQAIVSLHAEIAHKNIKVDKALSSRPLEIIDMGLERVFTNLLRNAVDAVEKDGIILLSTSQEEEFFVFEISDNGCGLKCDSFEKIFEPFYTTKDIDKGCGLGLTIVSEIVKCYFGQIDIESAPGKGAKFIIKIPIHTKNGQNTK